MLWRNSPPTEMQTKLKIAKNRSVKTNLFLRLDIFCWFTVKEYRKIGALSIYYTSIYLQHRRGLNIPLYLLSLKKEAAYSNRNE